MNDDRASRIRATVSVENVLLAHGVELKRTGNSFIANCIWHEDKRPSMSVYSSQNDGYQRAYCHACGNGGSVIDVYGQLNGLSVETDMKKIMDALEGGSIAISTPNAPAKLPAKKVIWQSEKPPKGSRPASLDLRGIVLTNQWEYKDTDGDLIGIICRYVDDAGVKTYRPWTYGKMGNATLGWQPRTWTPKRPLYGLDKLAANQTAKVLLVEGEKTADAAQKLIPGMVSITWPGGANGIHNVDWQPMENRHIVLIPDADVPGEQAMLAVASYLLPIAASVRFVDSSGQPPGWDLADATDWDTAQVIAWALEHIRDITSKELDAAMLDAEKKTLQDIAAQDVGLQEVVTQTATLHPPQQQADKENNMPATAPNIHTITDAATPRHTAVTTTEFMPPEFSEVALAKHWSKSCGKDWAFTPAWGKWTRWDGGRWKIDERNSVTAITCEEMTIAANWTKSQNLTANQRRSLCSKKNISNVLALAGSLPDHACLPEDWDRNPWLLGTPGGVVDLTTGKIQPATREMRITKQTAVAPEHGEFPLWDEILERCTKGDPAMRDYYQKWAGYTLTGDCREEGFLFIHGAGGSGKSKFVDCMGDILGDYCSTVKIETLMESKIERHTEEIASLHGARMVRTSEPEEGARWNEALLKLLTGRDTVSARRLYEKQFTFRPQFKLWINGNFRPSLKSTGEEIRRRMHFVNFPESIPVEQRIHDLSERLRCEWPMILQWMIDGCLKWQREGLKKPAAVEEDTGEYLEDEDSLGAWMRECCELSPQTKTPVGEIYSSYKKFAETINEGVVSQKRFSQRMDARGFERARDNRGARVFVGIRVRPQTSAATWYPAD